MGESRTELVQWVNELLQVNYTKIEQLGSGAAYCQIIDSIYGAYCYTCAAAAPCYGWISGALEICAGRDSGHAPGACVGWRVERVSHAFDTTRGLYKACAMRAHVLCGRWRVRSGWLCAEFAHRAVACPLGPSFDLVLDFRRILSIHQAGLHSRARCCRYGVVLVRVTR